MRHVLLIGIIVSLFTIIGAICYDGVSCRVFAGQPTLAPTPADESVLVNQMPADAVITAQPVADGACCVRTCRVRCHSARRCVGACRCQRQVVERPARQPLFTGFAERFCARKRCRSVAPACPEQVFSEAPVAPAPEVAPEVVSQPQAGCCGGATNVKVNVRVRVR